MPGTAPANRGEALARGARWQLTATNRGARLVGTRREKEAFSAWRRMKREDLMMLGVSGMLNSPKEQGEWIAYVY